MLNFFTCSIFSYCTKQKEQLEWWRIRSSQSSLYNVSSYYWAEGRERRRSDNGGPDELEHCLWIVSELFSPTSHPQGHLKLPWKFGDNRRTTPELWADKQTNRHTKHLIYVYICIYRYRSQQTFLHTGPATIYHTKWTLKSVSSGRSIMDTGLCIYIHYSASHSSPPMSSCL